MAGGQERILRRRIKTVQSTKKITRAMELIAASRIVKAQAAGAAAAVPYSEQITEVVRNLAPAAGAGSRARCSSPGPRPRRSGYVVITADRGLCGGYNASVHPRRRGRDASSTVQDGKDYGS